MSKWVKNPLVVGGAAASVLLLVGIAVAESITDVSARVFVCLLSHRNYLHPTLMFVELFNVLLTLKTTTDTPSYYRKRTKKS